MRFLMGLAVGGRRDGMYTDAVLNGVAVGGRQDGMIHTVTTCSFIISLLMRFLSGVAVGAEVGAGVCSKMKIQNVLKFAC